MKSHIRRSLQILHSAMVRRWLACLFAAAILGGGSVAALAADAADTSTQTAAPTSGKWTPRKLHFTFQGFTAKYSCDGLRDQMKQILRKLGARKDLVLRSSGCTRLEGPEPFPGVDATFSVLEPAPEGSQGAAAKSPDFAAAHWDTVTLNSDTPGRSNSGGCELIEQVKKFVLPLFTTRNLTYSSDCFPHSDSLSGTRLSVEVLLPVKPGAPKT